MNVKMTAKNLLVGMQARKAGINEGVFKMVAEVYKTQSRTYVVKFMDGSIEEGGAAMKWEVRTK